MEYDLYTSIIDAGFPEEVADKFCNIVASFQIHPENIIIEPDSIKYYSKPDFKYQLRMDRASNGSCIYSGVLYDYDSRKNQREKLCYHIKQNGDFIICIFDFKDEGLFASSDMSLHIITNADTNGINNQENLNYYYYDAELVNHLKGLTKRRNPLLSPEPIMFTEEGILPTVSDTASFKDFDQYCLVGMILSNPKMRIDGFNSIKDALIDFQGKTKPNNRR